MCTRLPTDADFLFITQPIGHEQDWKGAGGGRTAPHPGYLPSGLEHHGLHSNLKVGAMSGGLLLLLFSFALKVSDAQSIYKWRQHS